MRATLSLLCLLAACTTAPPPAEPDAREAPPAVPAVGARIETLGPT